MTIFYLPDLGEGLAEAVIHEWHIKPGDKIKVDQLMVSVETAKSIVEIPSPFSGKVVQLFSTPGATLKTGEALIDIETDQQTATVAGKLESSDMVLEEENFDISVTSPATSQSSQFSWLSKAEKISGLRLSMSKNMQRAHREVIQATIFDEADVSHWFNSSSENQKPDITTNVIYAICKACKSEPALNCWYDGRTQKRLMHDNVNLGLALDTPEGLLVPVIKNADKKSVEEIREIINHFKTNHLSPDNFQGATITLSNIGNFAGYFGTPIIVPPTVAIIAIGKINKEKYLLPLSLSFDHRVVTGGEAARFLAAILQAL